MVAPPAAWTMPFTVPRTVPAVPLPTFSPSTPAILPTTYRLATHTCLDRTARVCAHAGRATAAPPAYRILRHFCVSGCLPCYRTFLPATRFFCRGYLAFSGFTAGFARRSRFCHTILTTRTTRLVRLPARLVYMPAHDGLILTDAPRGTGSRLRRAVGTACLPLHAHFTLRALRLRCLGCALVLLPRPHRLLLCGLTDYPACTFFLTCTPHYTAAVTNADRTPRCYAPFVVRLGSFGSLPLLLVAIRPGPTACTTLAF